MDDKCDYGWLVLAIGCNTEDSCTEDGKAVVSFTCGMAMVGLTWILALMLTTSVYVLWFFAWKAPGGYEGRNCLQTDDDDNGADSTDASRTPERPKVTSILCSGLQSVGRALASGCQRLWRGKGRPKKLGHKTSD